MIKSLLALVLILTSLASANNCSVQFQKAVQFFESKQFQSAAEQFNRCLDLGVENADIYYNIGNSNHKGGNLALAILNYERSLKINPNHQDASHNLTIAETQKSDKQASTDRSSTVHKLIYFIPLNISIQLSTASLLIWITLVLFSRKRSDKIQLRLYAFAVIIFITVSPVIISTGFRLYQTEFQSYGIILKPQVQVLTGPSTKSNLLTTIHSGYKVEITDTKSDWVKIKIEDTYGWIKNNSLGKI